MCLQTAPGAPGQLTVPIAGQTLGGSVHLMSWLGSRPFNVLKQQTRPMPRGTRYGEGQTEVRLSTGTEMADKKEVYQGAKFVLCHFSD